MEVYFKIRDYNSIIILIIISGCVVSSRIDNRFNAERDHATETWTFEAKNSFYIIEPGTLSIRNTFNKNNQLVESIKYLKDGNTDWDHSHLYTWKGNKISEQYDFTADSNGNKILKSKKLYYYDAGGKKSHSDLFDAKLPGGGNRRVKWNKIMEWEYKFDSNDSLIEETSYSKNNQRLYSITYQYDTLNNTATRFFLNPEDMTQNNFTIHKYDSSKVLVYKIRYTPFGSSYDSTAYLYHYRKMTEQRVFDKSGRQLSRITYIYFDNDLLRETHFFDKQDNLTGIDLYKYIKSEQIR